MKNVLPHQTRKLKSTRMKSYICSFIENEIAEIKCREKLTGTIITSEFTLEQDMFCSFPPLSHTREIVEALYLDEMSLMFSLILL